MSGIIKNLSVSMTLDAVTDLATAVLTYESRVKSAEDALGRERADFAAYRNAEIERNANVQRHNDETLQRRLDAVEKNERKNAAYSEYLNERSQVINEAWEFIRPKVGRNSKTKMLDYMERLNAAWLKFDNVQKECAK